MSTDEPEERDAAIRRLSREGRSVRGIARELGVSKSQVHRVLIASPLSTVVGGPEEDDEDTDEDPWELGENGLPLDTEEERWPPEPFTFVGRERRWLPGVRGEEGRWTTVDRWVDGNGCSLGDTAPLTFYRYEQYLRHELDDPKHAERVVADVARQIAAWERRGV